MPRLIGLAGIVLVLSSPDLKVGATSSVLKVGPTSALTVGSDASGQTSAAAANQTITAVAGIKVGHYTLTERPTGCTVILVDGDAVGGVSQRGGAPGTRETDLLRSENMVDKVNAVVLAGGSAFGLDAATGASRLASGTC